MKSTICIFEDCGYENLLPLVYFRPVFGLRCGILTLYEKIKRLYPGEKIVLLCRDYLTDKVKETYPDCTVNDLSGVISQAGPILFINGRLLAEKNIPVDGPEEIGVKDGNVVYIRIANGKKLANVTKETILSKDLLATLSALSLPQKTVDVTLINYPWNLIQNNSKAITADFHALNRCGIEGFKDESVRIYGDLSNVYIAKDARVEAGVVLDARSGPIYIAEETVITPPTYIDGPCYIGPGCNIDGAKIREGVSIGEVCRIGGELEESIIQGYTNKHHDGFLGHAYLGEWVNLGANTTNSDLKNDYGTVRIYVNGKLMDSGDIKVGCFIADHSKTGIGTLLNTGTVVGACCNIFGGGLPPKYIPSFAWGGAQGFVEYRLEKAIQVAKAVMERRKRPITHEKIKMTPADEALMKHIFEITAKEREANNIKPA